MKKILLVDDNKDNILTLALLLEEVDNISIETAQNGLEALELCKNENFDLIFMDLMMPVMSGQDATRAIKQISPKSMIVAVSALDDDTTKKEMLLLGAEDYIRKPIDSNLFLKRTQNYLELLDLRKERVADNQAKNLFTKEVYNRCTAFRITSKNSLAEFWEYYLSDTANNSGEIYDCVRIVYAFGMYMLNNDTSFRICYEEDDERMYFTVNNLEIIREQSLKNILLRHYPKGKYIYQNGNLSFMIYKKSAFEQNVSTPTESNLSKEDEQILRKEHLEKISAAEYVDNTPINIIAKIEELEENEENIDVAIVNFETKPSKEALSKVGELFFAYALVIEELVEFQHLAYAIETASKLFSNTTEEQLTPEKNKKITLFLNNMLTDLSSWRKTIFIEKSAIDIHYLDSSLLSSCLSAEMLINDTQNEDEGEIEFF